MKNPPKPSEIPEILEEHNLYVLKMPYFSEFIKRLTEEKNSSDVYMMLDDVICDLEELHDHFTPDFDSDFDD